MDQQQHLEPPRLTGERVFERTAVAMRFKVAKRLLDLHSLGVERDNSEGRQSAERLRNGEQPRLFGARGHLSAVAASGALARAGELYSATFSPAREHQATAQ